MKMSSFCVAWTVQRELVTFLDIKSIFHFEFIPKGQTVNQVYYVETMKRLHESVRRKRPELWPSDWILHHENAPAHKTHSVKHFVPKIDYWNATLTLFLCFGSEWLLAVSKKKMSSVMGWIFSDAEDIQKMWRWHWKLIRKRSSKMWQSLWAKSIAAEGENLEGDPSK
jgi:hypothetical protein